MVNKGERRGCGINQEDYISIYTSLVAQTVKCPQCRRPGFEPWVGKILWRRKWQPSPVLLPGKFHEPKSLIGYSPWGRKELDMTEQLHFTSLYTLLYIKEIINKDLIYSTGTSTQYSIITYMGKAYEKQCTVLSHSVTSDSLRLHGLQPAGLLCP